MKTTKYSRFLGMNTKLPDYSLNSEEGRWLKEAKDVHFRNDGSVIRRKSVDVVSASPGAHSLFEDMFVLAGVLYRFTTGPFAQTMLQLLSNNNWMTYCRIGSEVFMSNGTDAFRLTAAGEVRPWYLAAPAAPSVAPISGALTKGRYTIQISYSNADEEGILSEPVQVETDEALSGGFRVTLPAAIPFAEHINIYVSGNDGAVPLLAGTVPVGTATFDIAARPDGREAHRRVEFPLPAGTRLFEFNGRLCSVEGKRIWISVPYRAGYCEQGSAYVEFHGAVSVAVGNQMGVFVVAGNETMFLAGQDIGAAELVRDIAHVGAVPGTEFIHPEKPLVGWFSKRGAVLGAEDGSVAELMANKVAVTPPASGCSYVIETPEMDVLVSCGWSVNLGTGAIATQSTTLTSASGSLGTTAAGIVTTNGTATVDSLLDFGLEDFGSEQEKRMPAIYIECASAGQLEASLSVPGGTEYDYLARSYSTHLDTHRIDPGKGLKGNRFNIKLTNPSGVNFTLAGVSFAPAASTRRI